MSLINEALKKAQKQRTGDAPNLPAMPSIGGETAERIARRDKPAGFNTLLLRVGLGLAGVAVIIAGTVIVLRNTQSAPAPAPTTVAAKPAPTPAVAAPAATTPPAPAATANPATQVATQPVATAKPAESAPLVVATTPAPAPAKTEPAPATPAPSTVVIFPNATPATASPTPAATASTPSATITLAPATPEPAAPKPAGPPPKIDPKGINFIDSIRVAGIRVSSTDSKVLMNDRVYRIGDTVEHELGIRLVGIKGTSLTFEDERGARYTRNF